MSAMAIYKVNDCTYILLFQISGRL